MWTILAFYGALSFTDGQWVSDQPPKVWGTGYKTEISCYQEADRKLGATDIVTVAAPITMPRPRITVVCVPQKALTS